MVAKPDNILFARFFNTKDATGHVYAGFYQNLGLDSSYSALTVLQEIASLQMNQYLYGNYSNRYVTDNWASYMTWDKESKSYIIDPIFWTAFGAALCAELDTAQNLYELTQIDWEVIEDVVTKVSEYGTHAKTRERGNDTTTTSERQDTHHQDYAQRQVKQENDIKLHKEVVTDDIATHKTVDTNEYAKEETDVTTENDKAAFNPVPATNYSADTKSRTHGETVKARTDTLTTEDDPYQDTHTTITDPHKDEITTTDDAHHDVMTDNIGAQTTTDTYGTITDRSFEHTDTVTTTTDRAPDPAELLEIKKQLAAINAYKVVGDAIAKVILRNDWGWC